MKLTKTNNKQGLLIFFALILLVAITYRASIIYNAEEKSQYDGFVIR